jgi:hypothetical protein
MSNLGISITGLIAAGILFSGLAMPYEAFAETKFKGIMGNPDYCATCSPGDLDKKSDPDRKGHKVVKKGPAKKDPPKKEPPKKDPPKKDPPKKTPPKKVAPKSPIKKK